MRADRLLTIVLLLQARGCLTAPELATELEVSVRTIYRDMGAIGTAGIPVYAGQDGYRLVNGYRTRLTGLTAEEARGLVLAGLPSAAAELGLAEAVAAARLKLDAALPESLRAAAARMRQRLHFDAPTWYDDGDSSDYLTAVADAVWRQRVIDIRYDSWKRLGDHRLQPYGLVLKTGRWYLVAGTARGVPDVPGQPDPGARAARGDIRVASRVRPGRVLACPRRGVPPQRCARPTRSSGSRPRPSRAPRASLAARRPTPSRPGPPTPTAGCAPPCRSNPNHTPARSSSAWGPTSRSSPRRRCETASPTPPPRLAAIYQVSSRHG